MQLPVSISIARCASTLVSAFVIVFCLPVYASQPQEVSITSPDGKLAFTLNASGESLRYHVDRVGQPVIAPSSMGLRYRNADHFAGHWQISTVEKQSVDEKWEQPWGEQRVIRDNHNEVFFTFTREDIPANVGLRVRVFNDGVGFRYEGQGNAATPLIIMQDMTEFRFSEPAKTDVWWIPAQGWNRYEYLYQHTKMPDMDRVHTPLTMRLANGTHIAIHEAALVDFAAMYLNQKRDGVLQSTLVEQADGTRVHTHAAFVSPWRTIQVTPQATGLLNSHLILNLNEPNKLGDVSWVEPGRYVGIWWGMHIGKFTWGTDKVHGATTDRTKEYMDFAARHNFDGVLVEGWNIGWDGNWFDNGDVFSFTESYPDFDIKTVTDYGKSKGVRLIGHHETSGSITNYEKQMDAAYQLYANHGVRQIKTGYVADGGDTKWVDEEGRITFQWHDSQPMVEHYLDSVKLAAKYQLSINTHEPIKATGLRRTYPNWISREGARGQEFNAWGSPPNSPAHTATLPYTRLLGGPMDFTPGIVNLAPAGLDAENRVQTTLAKQLALYVVLYSPIQMAADLPEHYEQQPEALAFIEQVPTDWERSVSLSGEVGEYVVTARQERNQQNWYVGALTNETARKVSVDLSFLEEGAVYQATLWRDGSKADWKTNPYDMVVETRNVRATETLTFALAPSGGAAIQLVKL